MLIVPRRGPEERRMEIEWTDTDPVTGERRYVNARKWARKWEFRIRHHRRGEWERTENVSRDMWETLLEAMDRRYWRREGIHEEDLKVVKKILAEYKEPPTLEDAE
jgi:hypothetical protein